MSGKEKAPKPVIGTTCPALYKENYEYHLSGDCKKYLYICIIFKILFYEQT